ncbi:MAG: MBL fold metallo-hydrolase [Acholeplasmataceae bacterium]|nr:MBL fold metallo-hydrolase [Acholeplasmataceae bacterium]
MTEQLYPNIYRLRIPLPKNPLKELNCYVIAGKERSLIIDTGFNRPECEEALLGGIAELGIALDRTDVLLTHRHSDHTGLAHLLEERGARVFAGRAEQEAIRKMAGGEAWVNMNEKARLLGLEEYGITVDDHPGYRYRPLPLADCRPLAEGDRLSYGGYDFEVVDIPGHTPGHIGLYEAEHKLFFCGDHILFTITPNITFWDFRQDSLAQYFASLRKVAALPIELLFTAHRELVSNHLARIEELLQHHEKRLAEVMAIMAQGEQTASRTAAQMHWDIRARSWEDFPKAQKWFATGEAAAHLEYLVNQGRLQRRTADGIMYYRLPA